LQPRVRYSFSVFVLHFSPQFEPLSDSLFNRAADALDGNAPAFPDSFTLETLLVPAEASHSSVFALSSRKERNFRLFVFNQLQTCVHSFSLFAKE
jgi:hypothetical protein